MLFLLVSIPLGLVCGSQLECPGLCEQSLHGDALYSGKHIKIYIINDPSQIFELNQDKSVCLSECFASSATYSLSSEW